jgi:CheY-like chemotaxis protein
VSIVLIIDDEPDDIELGKIALNEVMPDIDVKSALGGSAALALLRNRGGRPDLILLDLKMPGMNGVEVLREIRSDDRLKDLPVVVVTSSPLESDRADAMAAGASYYMQKPFALDRFSKDLESILCRFLPK